MSFFFLPSGSCCCSYLLLFPAPVPSQALIEKLITDASTRGADDDDGEKEEDDQVIGSSRSSTTKSKVLEECRSISDVNVEDDLRWAGYALYENIGSPSVALLHSDKGLLYYRRLPSSSSSSLSSSPATETCQALLQSLPKSGRRYALCSS